MRGLDAAQPLERPTSIDAARARSRRSPRELRNRKLGGWKWRRQVPRGDYILDFYCADAALVVELDGPHHLDAKQAAYDTRRTAKLEEQGLTVMRIDNETLFTDI